MKAAVTGPVVNEDVLRAQLGVDAPKKKFKLPDSYRTIFDLDPQDIIDFFDAVIDQQDELVQVDFVVPSSMLEHRVERLKRVIAASRAVIEGMAANIIKISRGKDDPLLDDKAAREKYKREESARIARCNVKLFQYREAFRSEKELHQKIWRTVTKPVYFRDEVDDHITFRTVTDVRWVETEKLYTGKLQTHSRVELLECLRLGSVDLGVYRAVMSLGDAALMELGETEANKRKRGTTFGSGRTSSLSPLSDTVSSPRDVILLSCWDWVPFWMNTISDISARKSRTSWRSRPEARATAAELRGTVTAMVNNAS